MLALAAGSNCGRVLTVAHEDGGHGGEHGAEEGVLVPRRRRGRGAIGLGGSGSQQRRLGVRPVLLLHSSGIFFGVFDTEIMVCSRVLIDWTDGQVAEDDTDVLLFGFLLATTCSIRWEEIYGLEEKKDQLLKVQLCS
jgi:hypothetical protein